MGAEEQTASQLRPEDWLERAKRAFESGRLEEAKRLIDRIYQQEPEHQGALELLSLVEDVESEQRTSEDDGDDSDTFPGISPADAVRSSILGLLKQLRIDDARWELDQALAVFQSDELLGLEEAVRSAELREERLLERLGLVETELEAARIEEVERLLEEFTSEETRHPEVHRLERRLEDLRETLGTAVWQITQKRDDLAREARDFFEAGLFIQAVHRLDGVADLDPDWPELEVLHRDLRERQEAAMLRIEILKSAFESGDAAAARAAYEALISTAKKHPERDWLRKRVEELEENAQRLGRAELENKFRTAFERGDLESCHRVLELKKARHPATARKLRRLLEKRERRARHSRSIVKEQLDAGDLGAAEKAWEQARDLDRSAPALAALEQELEVYRLRAAVSTQTTEPQSSPSPRSDDWHRSSDRNPREATSPNEGGHEISSLDEINEELSHSATKRSKTAESSIRPALTTERSRDSMTPDNSDTSGFSKLPALNMVAPKQPPEMEEVPSSDTEPGTYRAFGYRAGAATLALVAAVAAALVWNYRNPQPPDLERIRIEGAGPIEIGCREGDALCAEDEGHPRTFEIPFDFELATTETTESSYRRCVRAGKCDSVPNSHRKARGELPQTRISLAQAEKFCAWVAGRLPTEIEWEIAARWNKIGSDLATDSPGREDVSSNHGARICCSEDPGDGWARAAPVDELPADRNGFHGLAGNVAEWTSSPYATKLDTLKLDMVANADTRLVVARGGSWLHPPEMLRPTARQAVSPGLQSAILGFRCAWDPQDRKQITMSKAK